MDNIIAHIGTRSQAKSVIEKSSSASAVEVQPTRRSPRLNASKIEIPAIQAKKQISQSTPKRRSPRLNPQEAVIPAVALRRSSRIEQQRSAKK